ncbi:MAG: TonB-dependent receptor [Bacteroidales bacterium]|nr:TonB-dependent receptor [Bacteroidales bacterium]
MNHECQNERSLMQMNNCMRAPSENKNVVLRMKKCFLFFIFILVSGSLFAQKQVTGQVLDETGEPMPGVNVVVKGTTQGSITDMDGKFTVGGVTDESTLVFTFIGTIPQEVTVGEKVYFEITMKAEATELDEVVVVGYGEVKRANVVGAVVDVSAREIEEIPATNLATLLEGRLAGVKVGQSSGNPNAATSLSIRIAGTWNNESPIFVIDGIVYEDMDRFNMLDPSEIESISVLKDASAAVYGAKSAGGVVVVKTKRGREGKPKITYSGSYGFSKAAEFPEMLSAYEQASLINARYLIENPDPDANTLADMYSQDELDYFRTVDYNWLDEAWQTSYLTRHTMNIQGGSDKVRYFGGGSYYYQTGNFENLNVEKYTLRLGLDADVTKDLTASLTLSSNNIKKNAPYNDADKSEPDPLYGTFKTLLNTPRWVPPYIDGKPVGQDIISSHPMAVQESGAYSRNRGMDYDVVASMEYRMPFIKGMKARFSYTYLQGSSNSKSYREPYFLYNFEEAGANSHIIYPDALIDLGDIDIVPNGNGIFLGTSYDKGYQINTSLSWARTFGKHDINVLAIYEQSERENTWFKASRTTMVIPAYEYIDGFSDATEENDEGAGNGASLGYIGRLNYSYAQKYILETAFRYEGSTRFSPEQRWGFFPSVAVGWRVSEESFFKDNISFINYLKLRGSAGILGNDRGLKGERVWELSFKRADGAYLGGTNYSTGLTASNGMDVNPSATWEKTRSYNGGVDMRFLDDFSMSYDIFYKYTYDILTQRKSSFPSTVGIPKEEPQQNFGVAQAYGMEMEVGYDKKLVGELVLHLSANIGFTRSMMLVIDQNPTAVNTWHDDMGRMDQDEPGYIATGIIRTQEEADALIAQGWTILGRDPEPGMMNYMDMGSAGDNDSLDGIIDKSDMRAIEKFSNPPYNYGFQIGLSYKGFNIATNFTGASGHNIYMEGEVYEWTDEDPEYRENVLAIWSDYWSPDNPDAEYPRPYNNRATQKSTFWARNGNVLRMNAITASYDLPKKFTDQYKIPPVSFIFTGRNLWTVINPFEYKDPAISRYNAYPLLREYHFAVKITI